MVVPDIVYFLVVVGFLLLIGKLTYDWIKSVPSTKDDPFVPRTFGRFVYILTVAVLLVAFVTVTVFFVFFPSALS